ncbi:hypothetical protein M0R45_000290 [Rubus argutus]|uniref:F-box domain-containing protein n=1 Tax=Rubus argutus TaxID=59490 RepID=A0AAW1VLB5_RUBAR
MKTMGHGAKQELPEGCKATIISFTSPRDACRLSSVSRNFKSAAESDAVWSKFLPPETYTILSQSSAPELAARSKKEIYFTLCDNPVLIHEGRMSFSLDKRNGKKCFMMSARNLWIICGDTPQYWTWSSHPNRFDEVAVLLNGCLLHIGGKIDTRLLSPSTLYRTYLVFTFTVEAYGFAHLTVEVTVGLVGTEATTKNVFLHSQELMDDDQYPKQRSDGWWKIELGEVFCEGGEDGELEMTCLASEGTQWKRGLIVQGIDIENTERN